MISRTGQGCSVFPSLLWSGSESNSLFNPSEGSCCVCCIHDDENDADDDKNKQINPKQGVFKNIHGATWKCFQMFVFNGLLTIFVNALGNYK